jgi:tetratricopeptide (TPR) repeat protein
LGCVLYECLAGEAPFVAPHISAVLVRILFEEPTPITKRRPGVPLEVVSIVNRLLIKDPAERWSNARDLFMRIAALGELDEMPHDMPTVNASLRHPTPRSVDSEQILLSLVLALVPRDDGPIDGTLLEPAHDPQKHALLLATLQRMGVKADFLLGGALVVTVPQMDSAKDQAALAARCAIAIKEVWLGAPVVVVTGRGVRGPGGLTGEVLDRAWKMLAIRGTATTFTTGAVEVDEVSGGLLATQFELTRATHQSGIFTLGNARVDPDAGRLLLGKPTPCVGRELELSTLEGIYTQIKDENVARAVLVTAPPGLGKSRLRQEFLRRLEMHGEQPIVLIGRADPLKMQSAYALLGDALRQRMELHAGLGIEELRERLRTRMVAALPEAEAVRLTAFIGEICGVPFPDSASPVLKAARQDPRAMYDHVEAAWLDSLRLLQRDEPVVLVLEDLHWSDALSVKLVGATLRQTRDHAVMVLVLARPEVHDVHPNLWSGTLTSLALHPLSRKAAERFVRQILVNTVDAARRDWIVEQAAGHPLYLEELMRASAEGKLSELPKTVAAMIQARIGRLPGLTRRALRAASVFGETFWDNGVRRLLAATHGDESVNSAIAELVREEIIEKTTDRRFASETQYRFRHALVREAAHGLVSAEESAAWHLEAGAFLVSAGETDARVLAEHFLRGNDEAQAATWYARAAEQSFEAGDFDGTMQAAERSLDCGVEGEPRNSLLGIYLVACFWRGMFNEAVRHIAAVRERMRPGSIPWCRAMFGLISACISCQDNQAMELIPHFLATTPESDAYSSYMDTVGVIGATAGVVGQRPLANAVRARTHQLQASLSPTDNAWVWLHYAEGYCIFRIEGNVFSAYRSFDQCVTLAKQAGWRPVWIGFAAWLAECLTAMGHHDKALRIMQDIAAHQVQELSKQEFSAAVNAVILARQLVRKGEPDDLLQAELILRDPNTFPMFHVEGMARIALAQMAFLRGDLAHAESEVGHAFQLLVPAPPWLVDVVSVWARILLARGKPEEAIQRCKMLDDEYKALDIEPAGMTAMLVMLADAYGKIEAIAEARQTLERAIAIVRRNVADAGDPTLVPPYLCNVPEHVRMFELADEWNVDCEDLKQLRAQASST